MAKKKKSKIDRAVAARVAKTDQALISTYKEALKDVRSDLTKVYNKYSKGGKLTRAEMAKYGRLDALNKEISDNLKKLSASAGRGIRTLEKEVYEDAYYRTAYAIELETGAKLNYTVLNPKVVEAAVQNPISGLTLNETLAKNRADVIIKTRQEITQGMIRGEPYEQVSKRLKDVLEKDIVKARRVVRTEAHRNQNQGALDSMGHAEDFGVKIKKVWLTAGDADVRDSHDSMEGQKVKMNEDFTLVSGDNVGATAPAPGLFGIAEEDINCRCTFREEIQETTPRITKQSQRPDNYEQWAQDKNLKI